MGLPLGFFDEYALPLGWFDGTSQPKGWFSFDFLDAEEEGGGGGGGGNPPPSQGGFGGGPGTYTLPAGLTLKQKKAMAALLACAPCCLGSGSGAGSGEGEESNCCGWCSYASGSASGSSPSTLSITLTSSCLGTRTVTLTLDNECFDNENPTTRLSTTSWSYTDPDVISGNCTDCQTGLGSSWEDVPELDILLTCVTPLDATSGLPSGTSYWVLELVWFTTTGHLAVATDVSALSGGIRQNTSGTVLGTFSYEQTCSPFYFMIDETSVNCKNSITYPVVTNCEVCEGSTFTAEVTL